MGCNNSKAAMHNNPMMAPKRHPHIYKYGQEEKNALALALKPKFDPEFYKLQCDLYFTHLESHIADRVEFYCSRTCVRWEWPPWDLLTGHGFINIMTADDFDRDTVDCVCVERTHKFFDVQPFGRSTVTFYYGEDIKAKKKPIKIYEEFYFNDFGQVTFIEAWSNTVSDYLPAFGDDGWPTDVPLRLGYLIPGLGHSTGEIDTHSEAMKEAAEKNITVKDFVTRSEYFLISVAEAHEMNKLHRNPFLLKQ